MTEGRKTGEKGKSMVDLRNDFQTKRTWVSIATDARLRE